MFSGKVLELVRCVGVVASVTVTVTLPLLAAVGVPVIWPVTGSKVRPAGNPVADQTYGVVPPIAATGAEYATPTTPLASALVVIDRPAAMLRFKGLDAVRCVGIDESVTVMVGVKGPDAVGVPVIWPVAGF